MTADESYEDRHVQDEHDAGFHGDGDHDGCPACEATWPSDRTPPTPDEEREADAAFDAAGFR